MNGILIQNRAILLCGVALLAVSCSSSPPQSVSQQGEKPSSKQEGSVSPIQVLRLQAEQGNAEAQFNLGLLYDKGRSLPIDKSEALRWYRLAAAQGDIFAQNALGDYYWEGAGVPKDDKEALRWWRLAADKGFAPAQHSVGKLLAGGGQGVPSNKSQAYMWLALSAAQGDEEATRLSDVLSKQLKQEEMVNAKKLVKQWKPSRASVPANRITQ